MRHSNVKYIVVSFVLLMSQLTFAQSYNTLLGARFGDDIGISVAQRVGNHTTLQLNHETGFNSSSPATSAYFVKHTPVLSRRLNVFAGIGAFAQFNSSQTDLPSVNTYGPSGTLGAEFTVGRLNIAADWSPNLNINNAVNNRFSSSTGITVRYVLMRRKSKVKSWREKMSNKYFKRKNKKK